MIFSCTVAMVSQLFFVAPSVFSLCLQLPIKLSLICKALTTTHDPDPRLCWHFTSLPPASRYRLPMCTKAYFSTNFVPIAVWASNNLLFSCKKSGLCLCCVTPVIMCPCNPIFCISLCNSVYLSCLWLSASTVQKYLSQENKSTIHLQRFGNPQTLT